jgi:RNA polymerase sigma-70 factor (ECF subfamily)
VSYARCITTAFDQPSNGYASDDEAYLVAGAREGNRAALESLLRRHYERCYALCRRLLGDDDDALDAAQEAMIAIARGIGAFDGRSAFATWVYRVTTNAAFDELRRRRRRPPEDWREPPEGVDPVDFYLADPEGSDVVGESVTSRLALDQALHHLSEEHRTAVVLRDMMGLEYAEIAEVLLVPIGTVRSRIARGRAALARTLSNETPTGDRRQQAGETQFGDSDDETSPAWNSTPALDVEAPGPRR